MLTYHNDPKLKKSIVAEMKKHQKQDQIIKGKYSQQNGIWKGCTVGCAIHSFNIRLGKNYRTNNHKVYEEAIGVPEWLARLHDTIFEGLPESENTQFAVDLLEAIPEGIMDKNLDIVKWKFCAFILKENIERVLLLDIKNDLKKQVVDAIRGVLILHENAINLGDWDYSAARAAASAAWAAERAAWAAAWAAERAAWAAAWAAERAAWAAAWAAERAVWAAAWAAERAAWAAERAVWAAYQRYAKELLRLLKEAGRPNE